MHPESSHKMVAASVTGVQLSGHAWYEQNASQHCDTSQGSSSHATSLALSIGVEPFGQPMELQYNAPGLCSVHHESEQPLTSGD